MEIYATKNGQTLSFSSPEDFKAARAEAEEEGVCLCFESEEDANTYHILTSKIH